MSTWFLLTQIFNQEINTCFFDATRATFSSSLSSDCELDDDDDDDETVALTGDGGGDGGVAFAFFFVLLLLFFFLLEDVVSVGCCCCCFFELASLVFLSLFESCFDDEVDFDFVDDEEKARNATVESNIKARITAETMVTTESDTLLVNCSNNDADDI